MQFVNESFPDRNAKAVVETSRCDGCAFCVDVCPTRALSVTASPSRPGRRIVSLKEPLCKGCGVCQATCPKEAISIPGLGPAELREYVRQALAGKGA